jgi:glycosyltransferase involved in cell wall biosynthesis
MRVCFVSRRYFPAVSGMSVYAANLLRELVALGHDVTMLSQYRADPAGTRVYGGGPPPPVPGVRVVGMESAGEAEVNAGRPADFERDVRALVDRVVALHEERPFDLVHAQYGYPPGLAALEAGRRLGLPVVVSIQGGDGHWVGTCCGTHRRAMQAVLGHADALLIGSRSFAEEVRANQGTPVERFTVVPGAVDVGRFRPRDGWAPGALLDAAAPRLLYHGRVDRRKGALDLVDAFARVAGARPARLVVSGIGPDSDAVAERVAALGLAGRVTLRGPAAYDDVPAVYREGDVFVSPTYAEGFSNTILEAMASGLPVVSTRSVGVVDCLRDGDNGLLVAPGDVGALAAALGRVLDDAGLRARLAGRALDEVRASYAWPAIARQIAGEYARVRGEPPRAGWSGEGLFAWPPGGAPEPCRFRAAPHLL